MVETCQNHKYFHNFVIPLQRGNENITKDSNKRYR